MGRYAVELDPELFKPGGERGYTWAEEPSFHWQCMGRDLLQKWVAGSDVSAEYQHNFLNPEGSEWLVCRPRQFNPQWYQDPRMADHVMRQSLWAFGSGVTCVEWEQTKVPGGDSYPENQWLSIQTPASLTSLDTVDYAALATAAGVALPGFATIAKADTTPVGVAFNANAGAGMGFHPMLQLGCLPPPQDLVVFGFGNLCFVVTHDSLILCRTPNGTKTAWERLNSWRLDGVNTRSGVAGTAHTGFGGLFGGSTFRLVAKSVKVVPVAGQGAVYFYLNANPPVTHDLPETAAFFGPGGWWFGAAPKQRILAQVQVMGYEEASTQGLDNAINTLTAATEIFDMGAQYKPTVKPELAVDNRLWAEAENPVFEVEGDGVDLEYVARAPLTYTSIRYQLLDETSSAFPYDGTKHKGGFKLELTPGTYGLEAQGNYLSPSFHCLELKFPAKLTERVSTPLLLTDTQWRRARIEASLREPGGKRFEIDLTIAGLAAFHASPLSSRENFPVHILEDTDGDGIYETVRARAWVREPRIVDIKAPTPDGTATYVAYQLRGKGLMHRLDRNALRLPQLVDPAHPGEVSHTYAVKEILLQCGFDTTEPIDPDVAVIHTDRYENASTPELREPAMLPGNWKLNSGEVGTRVESPWAPRWDQTFLEYLERNAKQYSGWNFYEDLKGTIHYHPDLMTRLLAGEGHYFSSGTLYQTKAEAEAAGVPLQYCLAELDRAIFQPEANALRVTGKDPGNSLMPQLIEQVPRCVSDSGYENFTGEYIPLGIVPEIAVDEGSMRQICRQLLTTLSRRRRTFSPIVPHLAPHELSGPGDFGLGYVLRLDRYPHAYQVAHIDWEIIRSDPDPAKDYSHTRISLDRLPLEDSAASLITEGDAPGDFPGQGVLVDAS